MRKISIALISFFLFSCNQIETGNSLNKSDIRYIESLHLLDKDEKIYKFYSEFKKRNAGNFFTDKRVAKYWIDEHDDDKNQISYAFYWDIKSIDTVYYAGLTYSPYMLVTKLDNSKFKVCADGAKNEIKSFFEDALKKWMNGYRIYNYHVSNYKEIHTEEPIFLDSVEVGSLVSINYDSVRKQCYGKFKIKNSIIVTSNHVFTHEERFIDEPTIRITKNSTGHSRQLDYINDTISMITKKIKFRMSN